jgi:pimeloyl-ACP methyl ester carboxylesterase
MNVKSFESRTVYANGHRIHLTIAGSSGPVVLLCHGFPESWYSWRHQLPVLAAAGYRAVAMDMLGYGRSSKPAYPLAYRLTALAQVCAAVVQELGNAPAIIVGHDIGAPVAWTAAWTRPDVFSAVVGVSLPFGGRGLACLPGNSFGEIRPSEAIRTIAGPGRLFYQEYFCLPDGRAQQAAEKDVRAWLTGAFHTLSADRPLPPELAGADLTRLPSEGLVAFMRGAMCVTEGGHFTDMLVMPDRLPAWLSQADLDICVAELEYSGLAGPMNFYRNQDLVWEELVPYEGKPIEMPSLFIGGDRDVGTIWSQEAIARAEEHCTDLRGKIIIPNCGHWIPQEKPKELNGALLTFLAGL